jgi:hypothetical protein
MRLVPLARLRSLRFPDKGASGPSAGPTGPAGPAGPAGPTGPTGPTGGVEASDRSGTTGTARAAGPAGEADDADEPPLRYWRRTMILAVLALMLLAISWLQQNGLPSGGLLGRPVPVNGSAVTTSSQP